MIKVDESDPVGELEPSFPYKDITIRRGVDMKEHYELQSEIGRGKFGTVFKCREKATGLMLAAKFVGIVHKQDRRNVEREVEIMCELQHPRLIQLYDAFEANNAMCFILELVEGGELFERVIGDDFVLTEKAVTIFMRQICEGVQFIHSKNILHLDLKPENILCLTKTGNRIKIIDFGLARKFNPENKLQVLFGTPEFVAPEVVNFDAIGFGTDMWSVGVICYVLLSGLSPFMGETDVETMANVTVAQYDFDDEAFDSISNDAKDFIKKLLLKDHKSRPTATECLSHRWMQKQKKPKKTVRKNSSKKLQIKPAEKTAKPVAATQPLGVSKEHLKEFCSKSRSQSPAEIVVAPPSPSLAQLRIQRDGGKSSGRAGESRTGSTGGTVTAEPKANVGTNTGCGNTELPLPDEPEPNETEEPHCTPDEPKAVESGTPARTAVEPCRLALQTVPDEPRTDETTEPLQSATDEIRTEDGLQETILGDLQRAIGCDLGIPFGKGLESKGWSKTTVTTSAGYRRSSDASFVQFASFRACTTTTVRQSASDFLRAPGLIPGGLTERLRTALLQDRASQIEGAQEPPPSDRRPKFKFANRDVPAGSPPPASNLMYYVTSKQSSSSSCRSAPHSKRASPEHESAKEMLLKLFYGDKNAEPKLSS